VRTRGSGPAGWRSTSRLRRSRTVRGSVVLLGAAGMVLLSGCGSGKSTSAPTTSVPATVTTTSTTQPPGSTSVVGATTTTAAAQAAGGCQNLVATAAVKAAVTSTYGQAGTGSGIQLVHIAPAPGVFFYGECGPTFYAATRFVATPGATTDEQVALQDDGAMMKYFSEPSGGAWSLVASQGFPGTQGCGSITQLPAALATLWAGCPSGL